MSRSPQTIATRNGTFISVASDYVLYAVSLALALFLTPLMFSYVGAAGFGLWMTIRSMLDYLGLLDGGLANSVPRFVARHRAQSATDEVNSVIVTSFVIYGVASVLLLFVAVYISGRIDQIITLDSVSQQTAACAFILASLALAAQLLSNPARGTIFGYQRLYVVNGVIMVTLSFQTMLAVVVLRAGWDVIGIAFANLIGTLTMGLALVVYIRRAMPQIKFKLTFFRKSKLREILAYSAFLMLAAVFMRLILSTDNIVIGRYLGVTAVASYALAFQLIEIARQLVMRVGRALVPIYSHNEALQDSARSSGILVEATTVSIGLGFLLCIGIALFGDDFLAAWVPSSEFVGYPTLWLLCGFAAIQAMVLPAETALLSAGGHRGVTLIRGIEAVLNLILSLLLVGIMGVTGVALATLVSTAVVTSWSIPVLAARVFNLNASRLLWQFSRQVILALSLLVTASLITIDWKPSSLVDIAFASLAIAVAYGLGYWLFLATPYQRVLAQRLIRKALVSAGMRHS